MTVAGAIRAAALQDARVLALLDAPHGARWFPDRVTPGVKGPAVVCQLLNGQPLQDHDGLDGLESATWQITAWADGDGADELAEELGRAVMAAVVERCRDFVLDNVRLCGAQVLATRAGIGEGFDLVDDPARRWAFDVRVWAVVNGG